MGMEISLVVPVYNEERCIQPFLERVELVFEKITSSYEIIFVLDPSSDKTEDVIMGEVQRNPRVRLMVLSRRFGQPAATMAGLGACRGDVCVVMDVDLQDPPELIEKLYAKLREGFDVVYAKRLSRKGESLLKRWVCWLGYRIIYGISDVKIPRDVGDFRIMSRRVVDGLCSLRESHGFLRGLVAFLGFRQTFIEYDRPPRSAGKGHYNGLFGSLRIGMNGMICFSNFLLTLSPIMGGVLILLGGGCGLAFMMGPSGTGLMRSPEILFMGGLMLFLTGLQLVFLGILGSYVGRCYDEVKGRPLYVVDKRINF